MKSLKDGATMGAGLEPALGLPPEIAPTPLEVDFRYLKIPNGHSGDDLSRYWLSKENEPTPEELGQFFADNPDARQRFVRANQVPMDLLDDWETSGYEKNPDGSDAYGYFFVVKRNYAGVTTEAERRFLEGSLPLTVTPSGDQLLTVQDHITSPFMKYGMQLVSARRTPGTFAYVEQMFGYRTPAAGELPAGSGGIAEETVVIDALCVQRQLPPAA